LTFIDFGKEFHSVNRRVMWGILGGYGIPANILSLIGDIYKGFRCQILHEGKFTEYVRVTAGVRQSCTLSPVTFLFLFIFFIIVSVVRLSPLGTAATTGLLYQPQMINDGDCGKIGGMKIGRGNQSTRRKPAPAPLCSLQIPHDQTRARTRAASLGSQPLTA
jgi:hypothetical protein